MWIWALQGPTVPLVQLPAAWPLMLQAQGPALALVRRWVLGERQEAVWQEEEGQPVAQ